MNERSQMILARDAPLPVILALRDYCDQRLATLRSFRLPWWAHWAACGEMYNPTRYRWLITPNDWKRGTQQNQAIVDETGMLAARTLATGMFSGQASPTKPWFRFGLQGYENIPEGPEKLWLSAVTDIIFQIYAGSNYYESLAQAYYDEVVFGSACKIQYEDDEDVVRFYVPCLGEFFFGASDRLVIDTMYREFAYTPAQCVGKFGIDNVSTSTAQAYRSASSKDVEIIMCHAIEPNTVVYSSGEPTAMAVPKRFAFREVYWEQGGGQNRRNSHITAMAGFHEKPFTALRWDVTSNDPYGVGPGMYGLPATRQMQMEQRRKAEGIDKMVRPPMVASYSMKNEPTDTMPGGVTYSNDPNAGFKPAFTVEPRIAELMEDIKEVGGRVERVFHNDLFQQFPTDTVRSATEIDAIKAEKVVLLGPVIERNQSEGLGEDLARTFMIAKRKGIIPPAPPTIHGMPLEIRYISMLAEFQRSAATAGIERLYSFAGSVSAVKPEVLDNLNTDETITDYADLLNTSPKILNDAATVAQIRAARAQQQQAMAALQTGQAAAEGAQTLSQTNVGGGRNALESMLGSGATPQ